MVDSIQHIRAEIHHRNGFIKKERGYSKLANESYTTAVNLIPWETHYRLQLAKSYEDSAIKYPNEYMKFTNLAIKEYQRLIEADNMNPWFKARLGLIYHDLAKKDPTNQDIKKAAHDLAFSASQNDSKNPLFILHYAHLLYAYKDIEKSKAYYLKAIEYDSDLTEAHFNLAAIFLDDKNQKKALDHYTMVNKQLLKLEASYNKNPTTELKNKIDRFQNARIFLASAYLSDQQIALAYELINKIPVSVEKYELLAEYYEITNQKKAALSLYEQLNNRLKTDQYTQKIKQLRQ